MTTVAILPAPDSHGHVLYRAVAGNRRSHGKTAGEALDALRSQFDETELETVIVVQHRRPDRFFTAEQQRRMEELMTRWRSARDSGSSLAAADQTELDELVEAELRAAAERAVRLSRATTQETARIPWRRLGLFP